MKRTASILPAILLVAIFLSACGSGTPSTPLAVTPTVAVILPAPPQGQIAYGSDRGGKWQVVVMDADGGNETSLTGNLPGEYSRPVWSPDGQRLAMREEMSMGSGIAVMNVRLESGRPAGSPPTELVQAFADGPTWSPDGTQLAYVSSSDSGGWRAYTVVSSGGLPHRLSGILENATDLNWSPDGQHIIFSVYTDPANQIDDLYVVNVDGSGLTQLTNTPGMSEYGPVWSPDGNRIAFAAASYDKQAGYGRPNIYVINVDGSGLMQVTNDPASEFDPAWSPDGTQIAFTSDRFDFNNGNYEIYIINADGTGELRLTNNKSTDRWPSWRAAPAGTTSIACASSIEFIADITIPNATRFTKPQDFSKVWRVRNSGSCSWTPTAYTLRFLEGEQMGEDGYILMPGAIQSGVVVDLAISLTAPAIPGLHMGKWGLFDGTGKQVPGPDGNPLALTVIIEVLSPGSSVLPASLYFLSEQSGSHQIWRMETDAITLTQVTHETGPVDSFDISPADGSPAYISGNQLLVTDRDGKTRRVIANVGDAQDARLSGIIWSLDGSLLAYGLDGIHVFNLTTGEDRLLIANQTGGTPGNTAIYSPLLWSPDGTKILVHVGGYEGYALGILSANDGTVLGTTSGSSMYTWMNDSREFYLSSSEYPMMAGTEPGLYLGGPDNALQNLLPNAFVWWPFQKTDGQLMFFISQPAGVDITDFSASLVLSDENGNNQTTLRRQPFLLGQSDTFNITWSPDGNWFIAQISRQATGVNEVLLFPTDDNPPVYLMQADQNFSWGR